MTGLEIFLSCFCAMLYILGSTACGRLALRINDNPWDVATVMLLWPILLPAILVDEENKK